MRLNKQTNLSTADHLVINDQPINIVDDFIYLGSYVGSTEHDVHVRIGFAWVAFAKLKSILRLLKPKMNLKIRLFKAECVSILLYGCVVGVDRPFLRITHISSRGIKEASPNLKALYHFI